MGRRRSLATVCSFLGWELKRLLLWLGVEPGNVALLAATIRGLC
jgi:hypothetical protein